MLPLAKPVAAQKKMAARRLLREKLGNRSGEKGTFHRCLPIP